MVFLSQRSEIFWTQIRCLNLRVRFLEGLMTKKIWSCYYWFSAPVPNFSQEESNEWVAKNNIEINQTYRLETGSAEIRWVWYRWMGGEKFPWSLRGPSHWFDMDRKLRSMNDDVRRMREEGERRNGNDWRWTWFIIVNVEVSYLPRYQRTTSTPVGSTLK